MYLAYSLLALVVFIVVSPYFLYQAIRHKKYIGSLRQRLGFLPITFNIDAEESIWIHAVSVGEALTAREAERLGLVNRVLEDEELTKTAREWAERLATGPTRALALTKQLVNASLDSDRATAFAAEAAAQEINMTTRDAQEGVASFVERRSAEYRGR